MDDMTPDQFRAALASLETDEKDLIPGGFDDIGEATDELQLALDTLHKAITIGISEKLQLRLASLPTNSRIRTNVLDRMTV
jgi:hypothetical protein